MDVIAFLNEENVGVTNGRDHVFYRFHLQPFRYPGGLAF